MRLSLAFCFCFFFSFLFGQSNYPFVEKEVIFPSMTLQNPLNSGKFGDVIFGIVLQEKTRLANQPDGNAEVYLGLGSPENLIGGGVTINIHGLTNNVGEQNNLGKGTISFHLNRLFFDQRLLFDIGADNAFSWGGAKETRQYI